MKNLSLTLALFILPCALLAQTNPDLPNRKRIVQQIDTARKHNELKYLLWPIYFVSNMDPKDITKEGYSLHDRGVYHAARQDNKACITVSLPGGWVCSPQYDNGKLNLWINPLGQSAATYTISVDELQLKLDEADAKKPAGGIERSVASCRYEYKHIEKDGITRLHAVPVKNEDGTPCKVMTESRVIRYREHPLPNVVLHLPTYADALLYRDLDPSEEPEAMIVVSNK